MVLPVRLNWIAAGFYTTSLAALYSCKFNQPQMIDKNGSHIAWPSWSKNDNCFMGDYIPLLFM